MCQNVFTLSPFPVRNDLSKICCNDVAIMSISVPLLRPYRQNYGAEIDIWAISTSFRNLPGKSFLTGSFRSSLCNDVLLMRRLKTPKARIGETEYNTTYNTVKTKEKLYTFAEGIIQRLRNPATSRIPCYAARFRTRVMRSLRIAGYSPSRWIT